MIEKLKAAFKSINPRSPHLIIGTILIIIIPLILLVISLVSKEQKSSQNEPNWQSYEEQVKKGEIKPAGKILEVVMDYASTKTPQLTIKELNKKNGYVPTVIATDHNYRVQLLDSKQRVLSQQYFSILNIVRAETVEENGQIHGEDIELKDINLAVALSWNEAATEIRVIDISSKQIVASDLSSLRVVNNNPKFDSIKGDEFKNLKKQTVKFDFFENKAFAQSNEGVVDVVYIGDKYTDMGAFHADVDKMINELLQYEPFKSRSSKFAFHAVENLSDLRCGHVEGAPERVLGCDSGIVRQAVNTAGVPNDIINVIVNRPEYGAGSADIAVFNNGPDGVLVSVHEFGHVFGGLLDEYAIDGEAQDGPLNGEIYRLKFPRYYIGDGNCYAGNPPAAAWKGIVSESDYRKGCAFSNWYAPSQTSIMKSLDGDSRYFNEVSKGVMNRRLDIFLKGGDPDKSISSDLYVINRNGGSGKTEVHALTGASNFSDFSIHAASGLHATMGNEWSFALGAFYDDDYLSDIYAINRNGANGKTEVHVLSGKSNFSDFALHAVTGLETTTGDNWVFDVGNGPDDDPRADLFAINKQGGSGKTEVHILQGGTGKDYKDFSLHAETGLHVTDNNWDFVIGWFSENANASSDIYAINRNGASGKTEVHVLSAESEYKDFSLHASTPLESTTNSNWSFTTGFFDNDSKADLYAINRNGASGKTEVHILSAASGFKDFILHKASGLEATNSSNWTFPPSQNFEGGTVPDPTATVAPRTPTVTSAPGVTVNPSVTKAPGVTNGPTSAPDPTEPVPTFVCGGSPDSICASPTVKPTKKPGDKPEPTSIVPTDTVGITPTITPPVGQNPDTDCLDPRSTPEKIMDWVSGFLKKINDYIQRVLGNPQNPPPPPQPCVIQ